jgi:hypothetical protein
MKSFTHEYVFRAPSTTAVFAAFFDPQHAADQDRELDIIERLVLEREETSEFLRRVCRMVPRRQLPALVRPLIKGQLHYVETATWHKREDRIAIEIRPSLLGGRAVITATYRLSLVGTGLIRRQYEGSVSVDVALIASRIECGIVKEFERSIPVAAACTQAFLDRTPSIVTAHA